MIVLREAIETGAWLQTEFLPKYEGEPEANSGENVSFRFKVKNFEKINLNMIEEPEKLSSGITLASNMWRVDLDLVNLCKRELPPYVVRKRLFLCDAEGYEFSIADDYHLTIRSTLAKSSGMDTFSLNRFPPKIRRAGAYAIELPDEFGDLFLCIREASLHEA